MLLASTPCMFCTVSGRKSPDYKYFSRTGANFHFRLNLHKIKGASENRRLFDRKIRLLELDDFGDSNAN